jgi:WD40 repeat protein
MPDVTGAERAEVMVRMTFGPNHRIRFSPDGALLAVCSANHVEVIDARRGQVLRLIRGHAGTVADVAFSPDGTVVVTGSYDGTARTWEVATRRSTASRSRPTGRGSPRRPAIRPPASGTPPAARAWSP